MKLRIITSFYKIIIYCQRDEQRLMSDITGHRITCANCHEFIGVFETVPFTGNMREICRTCVNLLENYVSIINDKQKEQPHMTWTREKAIKLLDPADQSVFNVLYMNEDSHFIPALNRRICGEYNTKLPQAALTPLQLNPRALAMTQNQFALVAAITTVIATVAIIAIAAAIIAAVARV